MSHDSKICGNSMIKNTSMQKKFKIHFSKQITNFLGRRGYNLFPDSIIGIDIRWKLSMARYLFGEFGKDCCSICVGRKIYCPQFNEYLCPTKLEFLENVAKSDVDKVRFIRYLILSNPRYVQSFAKYCGIQEKLHDIFDASEISDYNRDRLHKCIFNKYSK
jgi:hypothetical protein